MDTLEWRLGPTTAIKYCTSSPVFLAPQISPISAHRHRMHYSVSRCGCRTGPSLLCQFVSLIPIENFKNAFWLLPDTSCYPCVLFYDYYYLHGLCRVLPFLVVGDTFIYLVLDTFHGEESLDEFQTKTRWWLMQISKSLYRELAIKFNFTVMLPHFQTLRLFQPKTNAST
jgi:hypothetical protein